MNTAFSSDGSANYSLATGSSADQRLALQDKLLGDSSHNHLNQAGLSKGKIVWDIGCGTGVMTLYIAKVVGPTGHVYAMDASQEQLNIVKEKVKAEGLDNVTFILGDIQSDQNLIKESADIVYARFVLMHLPLPEKGIANMKLLLKENGVIASQEVIMSTVYCSFHPEVFQEYLNAKIALGKHLGADYDIGNKLKNLYESVVFTKVTEYYEHPEVPSQAGKAQFCLSLNEWRDKAIAAKVATAEDINRWERTLNSIPDDDPTLSIKMARQSYILASK